MGCKVRVLVYYLLLWFLIRDVDAAFDLFGPDLVILVSQAPLETNISPSGKKNRSFTLYNHCYARGDYFKRMGLHYRPLFSHLLFKRNRKLCSHDMGRTSKLNTRLKLLHKYLGNDLVIEAETRSFLPNTYFPTADRYAVLEIIGRSTYF